MANTLYNKIVQALVSASVDRHQAENSLNRLLSGKGVDADNLSVACLRDFHRNLVGCAVVWGDKNKVESLSAELESII